MTTNVNILPPSMRVSSNTDISSNPKLITGKQPVDEDFWNLDLSDLLDGPGHGGGVRRGAEPPPPVALPSALRRSKSCGDDDEDSSPLIKVQAAANSTRGRSPPRPPRIAARSRSDQSSSPAAASSKSPPRRSNTSPTSTTTSSSSRRAPPPVVRSPRRGTTRTTSASSSSPKRKSSSKSPLRHLPLPSLGRSTSAGSTNSRPRTSSASAATGDGSTTTLTRCVSFDKVQVREFQQILGDSPCKDNGPSLGLGWNYKQAKDTDLEKYEKRRSGGGSSGMLGSLTSSIKSLAAVSSPKETSINAKFEGRSGVSQLSPNEREIIAIELGYSWEEIQQNKKQNKKIQKQREKTLKDDKMEAANKKNNDYYGDRFDPTAFLKAARLAHGYTTT